MKHDGASYKGVGVAHKIMSLQNQPEFSQVTMEQYWLSKIKPKQVGLPEKLLQNSVFKKLFVASEMMC